MTGARCSDGARLRGDPLVGTAPPARRWLLVEQAGGWLPSAFEGIQLATDVKQTILQAADDTATRILLIRRPGRVDATRHTAPAWCVVDPEGQPSSTWGTWSDDADLASAAEVLRARAPLGRTGPRIRVPPAEPELLLVCTHGRKDVCCAVRGRPVAAALAARWPEATWECSHTGGDRFAANLVVLPGGVVYGGLDPDTAAGVVQAHHTGMPSTAHLRGVAGHPPAVQAAVAAVHTHHGALPWGAVTPKGTITQGAAHTVTLQADGTVFEVRVVDEVRQPHWLTCHALAPGRATVPVVSAVRTIAG